MERNYRERQQRSYTSMRMIYDFTMAVILLSIGLTMLLGDKFGIPALKEFISGLQSMMRYFFGSLCVLYGSFRLYRAIKHDY